MGLSGRTGDLGTVRLARGPRHPLARIAARTAGLCASTARTRLGPPFEGDTTLFELLLEARVLRLAKVREGEF